MTDFALALEPPPADPRDLPDGTVVYLDNRPKGHPAGPDLWTITYLDGEWLCPWGRVYELAGVTGGEVAFVMTPADQAREVAELGADPETVAKPIRVAEHTGLASCCLCRHVYPDPAEQCPACYMPAEPNPSILFIVDEASGVHEPKGPWCALAKPRPEQLDFEGEFGRGDERPTPLD